MASPDSVQNYRVQLLGLGRNQLSSLRMLQDKINTPPLQRILSIMTADPIIIHSPLEGRIVRDGQGVEVRIYKSPDTDWLLEVVDDFGNSTTWQDLFVADQEAYDAKGGH